MKQRETRILAWTAIVFSVLALASCAKTPPMKTPNGIASLEKVKLGGVEQWILIRGQDSSNPVLLFLHGGPGSPEMPLEHHFGAGLEEHFVVVHWDQRGAGKSYSPRIPAETMTIEQFVSDTHELAELLRQRLGAEKTYLVGHSWGTLLGTKVVQRYPELFYAYIGIGQCVDMQRNESISYQFVMDEARKRNNSTALRQLEKIGPPPYDNLRELGTQRKWLTRFGGGITREGKFSPLIKIAIKAPEYTPADFLKYLYGNYYGSKHLEDEVMTINFLEQVPRLDVPVYFFEGRHDYNTPWELVQEYYDRLGAPQGKQLIWFENSAHSPNLEEPEKFVEELLKVVEDTYPRD
jgi:pimeloyl-ACP methyl ester carboxylesterase